MLKKRLAAAIILVLAALAGYFFIYKGGDFHYGLDLSGGTQLVYRADTSNLESSEVEEAMAALEKMQQDAQQALQNKQRLYMAPVYLKVNSAIGEVAKETGYSIILTERIGEYSLLLFEDKQRDISDLVLKKFGVTPPAK